MRKCENKKCPLFPNDVLKSVFGRNGDVVLQPKEVKVHCITYGNEGKADVWPNGFTQCKIPTS